jgi:hypothetical protein
VEEPQPRRRRRRRRDLSWDQYQKLPDTAKARMLGPIPPKPRGRGTPQQAFAERSKAKRAETEHAILAALEAGTRCQSIRALAHATGLPVSTVGRAIKDMVADGRLVRSNGLIQIPDPTAPEPESLSALVPIPPSLPEESEPGDTFWWFNGQVRRIPAKAPSSCPHRPVVTRVDLEYGLIWPGKIWHCPECYRPLANEVGKWVCTGRTWVPANSQAAERAELAGIEMQFGPYAAANAQLSRQQERAAAEAGFESRLVRYSASYPALQRPNVIAQFRKMPRERAEKILREAGVT